MNVWDAVNEILDKAERIRLPGYRLDVVTIARREFAEHGSCDAKFIDPIELTIGECIRQWTTVQKRQIWMSTETGAEDSDDYTVDSIDMALEGELMYEVLECLSPDTPGRHRGPRRG